MDIEMGNLNSAINLIDRFADAGLQLQLAPEPIARAQAAELVFQMDIRRTRTWDPRSEYYVAWPGGDENVVVVKGVDKSEEQLVMMVHEPQHWFWEPVPWGVVRRARRSDDWRAFIAREGRIDPDDLVKENETVWVRRTTDARKRHFLVGRDERQLFMCRLPRACTTVAEAHRALRAPEATEARGVMARTIRQGEWFFIPIEKEVEDTIDRDIARGKLWVYRRASIGSFIPRAGKPHRADELVVAPVAASRVMHVYVRGRVRHVDHKTVRLPFWVRVVRNREVAEQASPFGGGWID
jgi:hypothetical protein